MNRNKTICLHGDKCRCNGNIKMFWVDFDSLWISWCCYLFGYVYFISVSPPEEWGRPVDDPVHHCEEGSEYIEKAGACVIEGLLGPLPTATLTDEIVEKEMSLVIAILDSPIIIDLIETLESELHQQTTEPPLVVTDARVNDNLTTRGTIEERTTTMTRGTTEERTTMTRGTTEERTTSEQPTETTTSCICPSTSPLPWENHAGYRKAVDSDEAPEAFTPLVLYPNNIPWQCPFYR